MSAATVRMWLRWSWRDLRARWVQVAAIALMIALGTGTYAGLSSLTQWRYASNDASFALTNMYDLRARLGAGGVAPQGALLEAMRQISRPEWVTAAEERLLVPVQVDASTDERAVLVRGQLIGVPLADGDAQVARPVAVEGRDLTVDDAGREVAMIEVNFARYYDLPPAGELRLAGGRELRYTGHAAAPEYFVVVPPEGGFFGEATFAAVFTSLETAQRLGGTPGAVNDLVLTLAPGADRDEVARELRGALSGLGATVTAREDDASYRIVTEDPEGDQQLYNVFAIAILSGAVFGAFSLTSRMVDAQRREIGVAMALGTPRGAIAVRPLLVGAQIALLGVVLGSLVGLGIAALLGNVLRGLLALPVFETPFQPQLFAQAAVVGLVVPVVAIAYPVWRAVRVDPVQAIQPRHLAGGGAGLAPIARRLPGGSLAQLPFRNLARGPRRTLLAVLGIAAVISVMVGVVGALDSFFDAIDRTRSEAIGGGPARVEIGLQRIYPLDSPEVAGVLDDPAVGSAEPVLQLGGTLLDPARAADGDVDLLLQFIDFESELWQPGVIAGSAPGAEAGILLSERAASDLGVGPGERVTLRHPRATGPSSFELVESELLVSGLHAHPFRAFAYLDSRSAALAGLDGTANLIWGLPAAGSDVDDVKRALFGRPAVSSVQAVTASVDALGDMLGQFTAVFRVIEGAVLGLAVLIAFNTASINQDDRRRDHATMFAFGLPVSTVMRMAVIESAAIGLIATLLGLVGGFVLIGWIVFGLAPRVMPEIGLHVVFSPASIGLVIGLGVLAVAIAPLFTLRRLLRMDIPSTLRVME